MVFPRGFPKEHKAVFEALVKVLQKIPSWSLGELMFYIASDKRKGDIFSVTNEDIIDACAVLSEVSDKIRIGSTKGI